MQGWHGTRALCIIISIEASFIKMMQNVLHLIPDRPMVIEESEPEL